MAARYEVEVTTDKGTLLINLTNRKALDDFITAAKKEYGIDNVFYLYEGYKTFGNAEKALEELRAYGKRLRYGEPNDWSDCLSEAPSELADLGASPDRWVREERKRRDHRWDISRVRSEAGL
jgi:hypothetical protein